MVHINFATREIITKIVYCGPTGGGKTSILKYIDQKLPPSCKGQLLTLTNDAQETIFFDHLAIDLGAVDSGMILKLDLYAVPGKSVFSLARKNILQGSDGLIFIADSRPEKLEENLKSLEELFTIMGEEKISPSLLPLIFQYHKQDLPNALSPAELNEALNPKNFPFFSSSIEDGRAILSPLKNISSLILENLSKEEPATSQSGTSPDDKSLRFDKGQFRKHFQDFLENSTVFKVKDLKEEIAKKSGEVSRRALTRQLNSLIEEGKLKKKGYGKGTIYYTDEKEDSKQAGE